MARIPRIGWWLLGAAVLLLIGGLGPWADVAAMPSVHGTHREGWVTIAAAILSAGLVLAAARAGWRSRRPAALVAVLAALSVLVAAVDLADVDTFVGPTGIAALIEPAWGIYLALAGAIALLAAALVAVAAPPGRRVAAES